MPILLYTGKRRKQTKCNIAVPCYNCCVCEQDKIVIHPCKKARILFRKLMSLASTFKNTFSFIYRLTSDLISALHPDFFFQSYICPHNQLTVGLTLDFFLQPYICPHKQLTFGLTLDFFLQPYILLHNQPTFGFTSNFTFGLTFGQTLSFTFGYTFNLTYILIQLQDFIIQLLDSLASSLV